MGKSSRVGQFELLDAAELARRLGVSARFVRRLVDERRVPYVKVGRYVRFDPVEVDMWLRRSTVEPIGRIDLGLISRR